MATTEIKELTDEEVFFASGTPEVKELTDEQVFNPQAPDMAAVRKLSRRAYTDQAATQKEGQPREALTFEDYVKAGWQSSVTGLEQRGQLPGIVVGEEAPWYAAALTGLVQLAGDAPAFAVGGLYGGAAGGAVGSVVPVLGTALGATLGAGAGAFALPAMLRKELIQNMQKGRIVDTEDYVNRALAVYWEGFKSAVTGAATLSAGRVVKIAKPAFFPATAQTAAEIVTLNTVAAGMEGKLPKAKDFASTAAVLGGLKMVGHVTGKIQDIYAETGKLPIEVLADFQANPTLKQDVLSVNKKVPTVYEGLVEKGRKVEDVMLRPIAEVARKASDLYTRYINQFHPLFKVTKAITGGKEIPTDQHPGRLAQLTRGSLGRADHMIEFGTFSAKTLEDTGPGLKQILRPVEKPEPLSSAETKVLSRVTIEETLASEVPDAAFNNFRAYMVSRQAIDMAAKGQKTGIDIEAATEVVAAGRAKYEARFRQVREFAKAGPEFMRDLGVLSEEGTAIMFEAEKNYVPLNRLMDKEPRPQRRVSGGVRQPIKKRKGSERLIVDPIESLVKNTYAYVAVADANNVRVALVELAERSPRGSEFVRKVKTPMRPVKVTDSEVNKFLEEQGVNASVGEALTVFRPSRAPIKGDQIVVFRNGKREVYEVDPTVADALNNADAWVAKELLKVLAIPAKTLRAGAVLSPDFTPRNIFRDQIMAYVNSMDGYIPFLTGVKGGKEILKKSQVYRDWLKSGGANAALVNIDRAFVEKALFGKQGLVGRGAIDNAINVVKSPIEALRVLSELGENATRVGQFGLAVKGKFGRAAMLKGGLSSREVTLDFARIGTQVRALNILIAFFNAQVQGPDRLIRRIKANPKTAAATIFMSTTLPSVLLWWANKDDPRYRQLSEFEKWAFWHVMTEDTIYRFPKSFEMGIVFGSIPERILDRFFTDNPDAFKGMTNAVIGAFLPNFVPTFAVPVVEQFAKKSLFTGRPIVPAALEGGLPEYEYKIYTTELTKALGRLVGSLPGLHDREGASPLIIDNYIRGWTGGLGNYAVKLADFGLRKAGLLPDPVKPAATLADMPVVRAFVSRYPSLGAQPVVDFFEKYGKRRKVFVTLTRLVKEGNIEAYKKELALAPDARQQLDDTRDAIGNAIGYVRMVEKNPAINADEKRQLIDSALFQIIKMAELGNKRMAAAEKVLGLDR